MGSGNYTRYIQTEENDFDKRVRGFLDDSLDTLPDTFENWPKERVKEAIEGVMRADQRQQDKIVSGQNGDAFIALHPEYKDTDTNGSLMKHQLMTMFGEVAYTIEQYEAAYQALRASNFLSLDKKELEKQQKAEAKARAEAAQRASAPPSQESLYDMPLEELRRLDAIENQQRMQRRGEEGGW